MSDKMIQDIKDSEYFDAQWYSNEYPDVQKMNVCPATHYMNYGWRLGRNPSPKFNTSKYLEHHQDVFKAGLNPLTHFIEYGNKEGRLVVSTVLDKIGNTGNASTNEVISTGGGHILNEYFDHVYVVNLERSPRERIRIAKHLKQYGVNYELWRATDGYKDEPLNIYNEYKARDLGTLKRFKEFNEKEILRGKGYIESAGAIGYICTYLSILKDALKNGYDKFLILEDDVILSRTFETDFKDFTSNISSNWKVLQLGASQYGWNSFNEHDAKNSGHYFPRRLDTCGSFAIALRGEIIAELIEAESAFEAPFDHLPLGEIYERYLGECFVPYPNIVMPDVTDSAIRGGRDQFLHAEKMKWLPNKFDFPLRAPTVSILVSSAFSLKYAKNFKSAKLSSVNVNLYGMSEDGLRPIHNFDDLSWLSGINKLENIECPVSDYWLQIKPNHVIVEEDVEAYVSNKLSVGASYAGPLSEINITPSIVVPGRVSVIIPTYKRPTNLLNALTSVAQQDYLNKEILVVNDTGHGSEYNADITSVVNKVVEQFPNVIIKFIEHKHNRNGAAARNTGLLASTGEYICYLDDDDIYLPGRLAKSVEALAQKEKSIGAVYCGFLGWNSPKNDLNRYTEGDLTQEILLLEYLKHYVHTNTVTYRRSAVLAINGFDESYKRHQDLEFNLRFFELFKITSVKEALVRLNPAPSDISNKVFNVEMLDLKRKFLGLFELTIRSLGVEIERKVYETHWSEVSRYVSDHEVFKCSVISDFKNGALQVTSSLEV